MITIPVPFSAVELFRQKETQYIRHCGNDVFSQNATTLTGASFASSSENLGSFRIHF